MRRTLPTVIILGLIWFGYVIWPLYSVVQIARAVDRRDVPFILRHVDFPSLRRSFEQQILAGYLKESGTTSPLLRGIAQSAMPLADPIVSKFITPEALANLLHDGWPKDALPQRPARSVGISAANVGTLWEIFVNSDYGLGRFSATVPVAVPPAQAFGLDFQLSLSRWRWQLRRVRLPEPIRDLIADELMKSMKRQTEQR